MMKKPIVIITKPNEVTIKQDRMALIQMAADDMTRTEIAEQVNLSVRTVELHFNNLKKIFGVKSMGALIAECYRKKLIK